MLSTFVSPKFSKIETLEQFYQHYHKYGSYFIEPKEMAEGIAYREGRGAWIAFGNPDARKELPLHVGNLNTVLNFLIKEKLFVDMDVTHIHVAIFEKLPTKDTATVTRLWTYWKEGSDWFWQDLSKQAHLFYLPPLSSVIERNGKMKLDMLIERF